VPVRFFSDDPTREDVIEWSFVPEGTPDFPFEHAFYSRTWELEEENEPTIGERDETRTWLGGKPSYPLPVIGPLLIDDLGICGTERQWQRGSVATDPIPPLWPNTQIQTCCKRPPLAPDGGEAWGNRAPYLCGPASLFPALLFMTLEATPGHCAKMNGTYPMVFTSEGGDHYAWVGKPPNETSGEIWTFSLACVGPTPGGCNFLMFGDSDQGNAFSLNYSQPFFIDYGGFGNTDFPFTFGSFGCNDPLMPDPAGTAIFLP
jgi:hypothetical protein